MPIDWSKPLFVAGTTLSSVTAGGILGLSVLAVPTILETAPNSTTLAKQWRSLFNRGIATMPPLALLAAGSYFASAYLHYHPQLAARTRNFGLAGFFSLAIVPFTVLTMSTTNKQLLAFAAETIPTKGSDVRDAVTYWGTLNFIRGLLPLAATIFAFEAL